MTQDISLRFDCLLSTYILIVTISSQMILSLIDMPMPCNIVVPYDKMLKRQMEVSIEMTLPEHMYDGKKILDRYAKVLVNSVHPDHMDDEIDIPTPNEDVCLRSIVRKEVLWGKSDIYLFQDTTLSHPSTSPMPQDGNENHHHDDSELGGNHQTTHQAVLPARARHNKE
jgi:hypothetical protein